ncbi:myb-like protein D [Anastrepha obliqua]|uniref:myb-like protein D n=1 Tax=Anastrepha obliqua TaxID=95512 RepID=UPI00240A5144|nr:myb-like protein D [Anastrepha obliqua]
MRASDERRNGRERRGNQEPDHDDNSQQPAPNVLPEQQTTTKAGKPRQRIAWTTKMNEDIMHCYYTATKLDTLKTGYRTDFHRLFIQLYPQYEHKITAQRVSDQKRAIMTNKLLTDVNIENIKEEVANKIASIHNNNIEQNITQNPNNNNQINDLIDQNNNEEQSPNRNTNRAEITNNPNNDMIAKTLNEINTNLIKWESVNPVSRPRIPKLIFKKDTIKYIETINNTILPTMLNHNSTIENIHTYIYVAAITTTILNNQQPITQNNKIFNSGKHKWQIRIENKVNEFRRNLGRLTQYKNASDERRQGRGRRGNTLLDQDAETNPNSTDNREQQQAGSVLHSEEATTKAGKPRQRMTWTREMNINVMRCYYKSTNIETNKTGYREDLHRLFVEIYPQYANITQQRVVDQKRTIVTNNRLTAVELQNIKEEIAKELQSGSQDNNNNSAIESQLETNNPNNTAQHKRKP